MRYTVLADHDLFNQVKITVYAANPDEAVALVSSMGFFSISQVVEDSLEKE